MMEEIEAGKVALFVVGFLVGGFLGRVAGDWIGEAILWIKDKIKEARKFGSFIIKSMDLSRLS